MRRARPLIVAMALLLAACGGSPEDADSSDDVCYYFDRFLDVLEEEAPDPSRIEERGLDLVAAGTAYGIRADAPGFRATIEDFAEAMDTGDLERVDEFINAMLLYCESYFDRTADR